jgi:hypothetical protein
LLGFPVCIRFRWQLIKNLIIQDRNKNRINAGIYPLVLNISLYPYHSCYQMKEMMASLKAIGEQLN